MNKTIKRKGRTYWEETKADAIIEGLRKEGVWCERLHSGCKQLGNRIFDLKARGIPQIWLPALGASLMVEAAMYTDHQHKFKARAQELGIRFALVADLEAAKEAIKQWMS